MDDREEMRRLIDVIEKGANNSSLSQAIDDIRLFSNPVSSFLANKLDTGLRNKDVPKKRAASRATKTVGLRKPPMPKTLNVPNKAEPNSQAPKATALSQADFDRLKSQKPQSTL